MVKKVIFTGFRGGDRFNRPPGSGLRQFGGALSATGRFSDGGRKCFMRKKFVFEIL